MGDGYGAPDIGCARRGQEPCGFSLIMAIVAVVMCGIRVIGDNDLPNDRTGIFEVAFSVTLLI